MKEINWFKGRILSERTEPFMIAPHLYYVGPAFVSCYLLDTGDGLVLLDQALAETVHLVFENIRRLGFDPADIRTLLVSHGHFDHCGGTRLIQSYTGAEICMSREDARMMAEHEPWVTLGYQNWMPFAPDRFYDDDHPIKIGRFRIHTRLTAGHTPGTTSFFFDVPGADVSGTPEGAAGNWAGDGFGRGFGAGASIPSGKPLRCALHGGIGLNTLTREWFAENPGWPVSLLDDYIASLESLQDLEVDIALPSHPDQIPIFEKRALIGQGPNPFMDGQAWPALIHDRLSRARAIRDDGPPLH